VRRRESAREWLGSYCLSRADWSPTPSGPVGGDVSAARSGVRAKFVWAKHSPAQLGPLDCPTSLQVPLVLSACLLQRLAIIFSMSWWRRRFSAKGADAETPMIAQGSAEIGSSPFPPSPSALQNVGISRIASGWRSQRDLRRRDMVGSLFRG